MVNNASRTNVWKIADELLSVGTVRGKRDENATMDVRSDTYRQEQERTPLEVNEMRMLRWMCGVTRIGKSRSEHIRGMRVAPASKKINDRILKWNGRIMKNTY